jgi:DUF218 domain
MTAESAPSVTRPVRRPFWFRRRSVPLPTWRSWIVIISGAGVLAWWLVSQLHGWLAVVDPLGEAPYIVVEGWAPDYVLERAVNDAEALGVKRIFTTGMPLEKGSFLSEFRDEAHVSAATLAEMGIEPQLICPAPAASARTERTRAMAAALKRVLDAENIPTAERRLNLYTLGTHGRRSRRIFQETLGSTWKVGVISVPHHEYEASTWYRQSAGAKTVIVELIALTMQSAGGD